MIRFVMLAALLGLTGCMPDASSEQIQTAHDRQCQGMGAPRGSAAYTQCRLVLYRQHESNRRYERARTGAMIQAVSRGFAHRPPPRPVYLPSAPRRVTCSHRPMGAGTVSTTCH